MKPATQNPLWILKNIDIYEGISEASLCEIAPHSFETNTLRGSQIYSPHQPNENIYVLKQGEVILYHSREGKRAIFDTLGPGAVFGSFDSENLTANHFAEASKPSLLCVTPVQEFLKIISRHPEAMLRLMQKMAIRIRDYEQKIQSNVETALEKVYSELVRLRKKRNLPLRVTHETIAELTHLNRVTVTRCIQTLKKKGWVTIEKNTGALTLQK